MHKGTTRSHQAERRRQESARLLWSSVVGLCQLDLGDNQSAFYQRLRYVARDVIVALTIDFDGPIERLIVVPKTDRDLSLD